MSVEYAKRAIADLDTISTYYRDVADRGTAERFEARLRSVIGRADERPASFRPVAERSGIRVALLITFPYKVFYRIIAPDRIRILHVRHTSRLPWP
jgi:plasmid stabilization system protein ParE